MHTIFTKINRQQYQLTIERSDSSSSTAVYEARSFLPHDLMHLVVERKASLKESFYGKIKSGANLEAITPAAIQSGTTSFGTEGQTTEIVVAILQNQYREPEIDLAALLAGLKSFLAAQNLAAPTYLTPTFCLTCINEHRELMRRWQNLQIGSYLELEF